MEETIVLVDKIIFPTRILAELLNIINCARKCLRESRGFNMSLVGFLKEGLLTQECQEKIKDNQDIP